MTQLHGPGHPVLVSSKPSETPTPIIAIRGVTMRFPVAKRYRELVLHPARRRRVFTALTDATFEVEKGDRIAILGANGAGKTTLLKLIGGLLLPSEGAIVVNGFNTIDHNTAARRSVGFVMNEERSFYWRLTAEQNLKFFGSLDNLWGSDLDDRIRDLTRLVGLEHAGDKPVSSFSLGMKQRLALARGLIAEPDVLILDEPTRSLDPLACEEFTDLIMGRIHNDSRKTLLIATHRLEDAISLCNKVMVIHGGTVAAFDSMEDLKADREALSQYYRRNVHAGER